jgi:hypothetical protein
MTSRFSALEGRLRWQAPFCGIGDVQRAVGWRDIEAVILLRLIER